MPYRTPSGRLVKIAVPEYPSSRPTNTSSGWMAVSCSTYGGAFGFLKAQDVGRFRVEEFEEVLSERHEGR